MYCNYCGGQNPDDAAFCGYCAQPLRPAEPVAEPPAAEAAPSVPLGADPVQDAGPAAPGQAGGTAPEADQTTGLPAQGLAGAPPEAPSPYPPGAPPPVPGPAPYGPAPYGPPPGMPAPAAPAAYTCVVCGYVLGPFEQTCPRCQTPRGMSVNPDAPVPGTYQPVPGAAPNYAYQYAYQPGMPYGNTSGMKTFVPPEAAAGWNWGGCGLGCIWAFAMGLPWWGVGALLSVLCCGYGIIYAPIGIVLGIKGNEWAWQNRRFESVEHFRQVQRTWAVWGIVVGSLVALIVVAYYVFYFTVLLSGGTRSNPFGGF